MPSGIKWVWVLLPLSLSLCYSGCRKEAEIADDLNCGSQAAIMAYRSLAVWHTAEVFSYHLNDGFFTSQTYVAAVDTTYSDGDGWKYRVDFGTGVVCTDGIRRKGSCLVTIVDSAFSWFDVTWASGTTDSFAFWVNGEWQYVYGNLHFKKANPDSSSVDFNLAMKSSTSHQLAEFQSSSTLAVTTLQPAGPGRVSMIWNGMTRLRLNGSDYNVSLEGLLISADCWSNWNKGILQVSGNGLNNTAFMDPYGNDACDMVYKVTRGSGVKTDEMIFNAW